jgi:hypothetical protein
VPPESCERVEWPAGLVRLPPGLDGFDEPYVPDLRRLYWVTQPLLDADDPKPKRPVVVIAVPQDVYGVVTFAVRSSTEKNGQFDPKHPDHGLSLSGWFSRFRTRSCLLWTPEHAQSVEFLLDEETFSYVLRDAGL